MRDERTPDREALSRLLGGDLPAGEARALRARIEADAALRAELERLRAVRSAVAATRHASFRPGFADRVMEALPAAARPVIVLDSALRRQFRLVLPIAAALLVALGVHNVLGTDPYVDQSAWEAALGLEPVTLDGAYAFDPVVYDGGGEDGAEGSAP